MAYFQYPNGEIINWGNYDPTRGGTSEAKRISDKEGKRLRALQAAKELRKLFPPGATAYTLCTHVSSSGMSRRIKVLASQRVKGSDGKVRWEPVNVSALVADATGFRLNRDEMSLIIGGCGMDMGFHVVYSMASAIYPKGTRKPHGTRNGEPDSSGGYAVNHRWL